MMRVWPSRFPDEDSAKPYARNGAKLASKVYVGRMGNETPEDAANFIGRGFLQLTGKDNYKSFAHDMRLPEVLTDPSLVEEDYAFETAMWFFDKNGLFNIAAGGVNDETINLITKRVNGGYHGLDDRAKRTRQAFNWLT
jgi:putative chitinase